MMAKIPRTPQNWLLFNTYNTHERCYRYAFINIMAHEMIHYYIAEHQIKDNKAHGREFMRMAQELNEN